jgi:dUTP pyrophosphatase
MLKLKVKRIIESAILPVVAHVGEDFGYDVFSAEEKPVTLKPGEQKPIRTGFAMEMESLTLMSGSFSLNGFTGLPNLIPLSFKVGLIAKQPSGLASKKLTDVKAGVIDSGYRNEIHILLFNYGKEERTFSPGDKIGQVVPVLCITGGVEEVVELTESSRGVAGWGSGQTDETKKPVIEAIKGLDQVRAMAGLEPVTDKTPALTEKEDTIKSDKAFREAVKEPSTKKP